MAPAQTPTSTYGSKILLKEDSDSKAFFLILIEDVPVDFRERGREREREKNMDAREKH